MSVRITTLPSGLRVVSDDMPGLQTTSLGVWIAAGSRHEAREEHGLSHLLEHMAFKGTRRRSARAIADEIETVGGDLNAATGVEQTAYYARVLAADTGLALDLLSDILIDSVFDPVELEREKNVILQEIGAAADTPDDLVFDLFNAAAFPDQPIGRPILGTPEYVSHFDRTAVTAYLDRHYAAPISIVAAAGAVDHDRLVEEAARRFAAMPAQGQTDAPSARYVGGDVRVKRRLEQTQLVIGFQGLSFHDADHHAASIFAQAVGGGMSSRLFQEVREVRGLAYSIYAFHWTYADTGLFGISAATGPRDIAELVPVSLDCVADAVETLTEAEMNRARQQLKVGLVTLLESSGARAEQIARQLLAFGEIDSMDAILARLDAVSLADVRRVGGTMLRSPATVAVVGSTSKVPDPVKIAARLGGR